MRVSRNITNPLVPLILYSLVYIALFPPTVVLWHKISLHILDNFSTPLREGSKLNSFGCNYDKDESYKNK